MVGRISTADEQAGTAIFLLSDYAACMSNRLSETIAERQISPGRS